MAESAVPPPPPTPTPQPAPKSGAGAGTAVAGDPDRQATIDELPEAQPQITFWQQPWVQSVVPFATSFIMHVGVIVLGVLLIKPIQEVYQVVKEQIIIPDATIIEGGDIGGIPNPGLGEDPNRAVAQDVDAAAAPDATGLSNTQVQQLNQSLMGGGTESDATNPLAIGPNQGARGKGGTGMGEGETGGGTAPFGIPGGGGGVGPKSNFMGTSGNATRLVFIVDCSGTMINIFPAVQEQLRQSINGLKPIQGFNIIFFNDDVHVFSPNSKLEMANSTNKRKAYEFIDSIIPRSGTDPTPAIQKAASMDPQLVFVLSDGFDAVSDLRKVVDEFKAISDKGTVKINTILIGSRNEQIYVDVMKEIASNGAGIFKTVRPEDLE